MQRANEAKNITSNDANTNVLIRSSPGVLSKITVNKASAQAIAFYNGTNIVTLTKNTLLGTLKASVAEGTFIYEIDCSVGIVLNIPASYTGDMTITHR